MTEPFAKNDEMCSHTAVTTFLAAPAQEVGETKAKAEGGDKPTASGPVKITVDIQGGSASTSSGSSSSSDSKDATGSVAASAEASAPIHASGPEGCNFAVAFDLDLREDAKDRAMALQTVVELVNDMFVREFLVGDLLPSGPTKEWYESNAGKIVAVQAEGPVGL